MLRYLGLMEIVRRYEQRCIFTDKFETKYLAKSKKIKQN